MHDTLPAAARPARRARPSRERGTILLAALAVALILAALAASTLTIVHSSNVEAQGDRDELLRTSIAHSAAGFAELALLGGGDGDLGSEQAPVAFGEGTYWTDATENPDDTVTVVCNAAYRDISRSLTATYRRRRGPYDNAVFVGNDSGDPNYKLKFFGTGNEADKIVGDVYCGGDLLFTGQASIDGEARALGHLSGIKGTTGVAQTIPDLAAMEYEKIADVDVAASFASANYQSNAAGGKAWQVDESDPAHIFRKNPSDRDTEHKSTTKDDYFLEDPYETPHLDPKMDGSDPYVVTLSGAAAKPGSDGNGKIYYIDGNLWIHNHDAYSFRLAADGDLAVTIVVRGNIYISDNIYYDAKKNDGLALIAMKDSKVADSGNIYFGDPTFGTLEHMSAFLYAENDFFDSNLSTKGSKTITVDGLMSCGNQMEINRDHNGIHSRLVVDFDPRVSQGTITLPGLPGMDEPALLFLAWLGAANPP